MISLRLKVTLNAVLDLTEINPAALSTLTLKKIQRLHLQYGPQRARLGDLFEVSGTIDDILEINDASPALRGIGTGMQSGKIAINGSGGDYLGGAMRGGEIHCHGDSGRWTGAGMRGGCIDITGSTGDFAGGGTPGATTGMKGGVILIGRHAGARLGDRMRRGMIVVRGNTGPYSGSQMIAGTLALLGATAPGLGTGMRRGTLLVADHDAIAPASFVDTGRMSLPFVAVLCRHLAVLKPKWRNTLGAFAVTERWVGDRGCGGLGELLLARGE